MNLLQALQLLKSPVSNEATAFSTCLACGFTPLHLGTFLSAHLRQLLSTRSISLDTGIYGDLPGNIERAAAVQYDAVAVVIEWQDLDARLGIRSLGGWQIDDIVDVVVSARKKATILQDRIWHTALRSPLVVCLPSLPLPPAFFTTRAQASEPELELRQMVAELGRSLASKSGVKVMSSQILDERSPLRDRFDPQSEILTGFPYTVSHASALAECLANLILPPTPKKAIIADLDDTLWGGLVGEIGADAVSWHLDDKTHLHGIFQQFLASLASSGSLIGIASKNDPAMIDKVFERRDLLLSKERVFPIVANWSAKSESVRQILNIWNIHPDSVVFVDDNPLEVAEVQAAFPGIEGIVFPKNDIRGFWKLLGDMRDRFGKPSVSEEDSLRLKTIRDSNTFQDNLTRPGEDFLKSVNASIAFSSSKRPEDRRSLELINKTNQFNLNGQRITEAEWMQRINDPSTFILSANYTDKFGALGKIAVLLGKKEEDVFQVDNWVMSCRAFSRRIEYAFLKSLFDRGAKKVVLRYKGTDRNSYLQEFLKAAAGKEPSTEVSISQSEFTAHCPQLFHQVSFDD
jgi:FkbH-like protein